MPVEPRRDLHFFTLLENHVDTVAMGFLWAFPVSCGIRRDGNATIYQRTEVPDNCHLDDIYIIKYRLMKEGKKILNFFGNANNMTSLENYCLM